MSAVVFFIGAMFYILVLCVVAAVAVVAWITLREDGK